MRGGIWEASDDSLSLDKSIVSLWRGPNILTSLSGQLGQGPGRYGRQREVEDLPLSVEYLHAGRIFSLSGNAWRMYFPREACLCFKYS
jgi:hypothetical protein